MPDWLVSLLTGGLGGAVVAFLLKSWIEARVTASVQHEYDQQLERYRKVELVAELFAEWIAVPPGELVPKDRRTRMNQLSFAAAIWLPSSIVKEMGRTLQLEQGAKTWAEVLLLARKELLGDESLKPANITVWGAELEKKGQAVIQRSP